MPEINDLEQLPSANASDDDLLLIWDMQNQRAYKVTRGVLLGNVARTGAEVEFSTVAAEEGTFTQLTPALLLFAAGGGIADMVTASETVAVPTLAAQASGTVGVPVEGAAVGMLVLVTFASGLAPGLSYAAHVSAPDLVAITFTNASAASITGTIEAAKISLVTLAI